jgi:hypothetical protein
VHLSQAVETLALRRVPSSQVLPLQGGLDGNVKVQFLEVSRGEFSHFENVSDALERLDQGAYGRCNCCRRRIESDLLTETPWATLCLECADHESEP